MALSLSLYTFLAPLLFWLGAVGLLLRLGTALLRRRGGPCGCWRACSAPSATWQGGPCSRRAAALGRTAALAALALSFGVSLAIFAHTYDAQQRVDAELTLGSDVKVTPGGACATDGGFRDATGRCARRGRGDAVQEHGGLRRHGDSGHLRDRHAELPPRLVPGR